MKNETAKREIESLDYYLQNHTDDYSEESHTAMMMAVKALEQEPILDKIRYEIESHCGLVKENHCKYCSYCNSVMGVREILEIIDECKAEVEPQKSEG